MMYPVIKVHIILFCIRPNKTSWTCTYRKFSSTFAAFLYKSLLAVLVSICESISANSARVCIVCRSLLTVLLVLLRAPPVCSTACQRRLVLAHTHTRAYTHPHTRTHTHAHTHWQLLSSICLCAKLSAPSQTHRHAHRHIRAWQTHAAFFWNISVGIAHKCACTGGVFM